MWEPQNLTCPECGKEFLPRRWTQCCCSIDCQHKRRLKAGNLRQRAKIKRYPEFYKKIKRGNVFRVQRWAKFWRGNIPIEKNYNTRLLAQDFLEKELSAKGFGDIFNTRGRYYGSPIDIFARKDGELQGFLVTTKGSQTKVKRRVLEFANYLGFSKIFIAWIRPDLSWYSLIEVQKDKENYHLRVSTVPGWKEYNNVERRARGSSQNDR